MFSTFFKKKNTAYSSSVEDLYQHALKNTRQEVFYIKYGVPDSFDGRFDLLLLHIFIILHSLMKEKAYNEISQNLFDTMFKDMDQTLREMGIGDMGIPKHMKRMMKAFNGRMHTYQNALESHETDLLCDALKRNLYGTVFEKQGWDGQVLYKMVDFVKNNIKALSTPDKKQALMRGEVAFNNES